MPYEINADYEQGVLFPHYLDDRLPADDPARFIRDFVKSTDLERLGFKVPEPEASGRPPYGAGLLLSAWLYGYFYNIRSTRGLERVCCKDLGAIWLLGWQTPDHNTLWRFINRNSELIGGLFNEITLIASKMGQVELALQALDGTKLKSEVSTRSCCNEEKLKLIIGRLDEGIKDVLESIKSHHETEEREAKLTEELKDSEVRKAKMERALEELRRSGCKQINPNDIDARIMKCGKTNESAYNAQVVVDEKSGIIVAQDVVNDENDTRMLTKMAGSVEENLGARPLEIVADKGYYSPEELMKAEEKGIEVLVNIPKQMHPESNENEYHKSKFAYDKEKDVFVCPEGTELEFKGTKKDRHNKNMRVKIYRCISYKDCPKRDKCSKSKRGKSIEKGPHYEAVMRQLAKQKEIVAKEKLRKRKSIAERAFAQIKWNMGFVRFMYRGLAKVKAQFALVCSVHNLEKIFKIWKKNKLIFAPI
jgi:transposase